MTEDNGATELLVRQLDRLFAARLDRPMRQRAEQGEWPGPLWDACEEMGLPLVLVSETAGGFDLGWSAAFEIFKLLGRHAVPLPLGETMIAAHVLAAAGIDIPSGPLTFAMGDDLDAVPWACKASHLVVAGKRSTDLYRISPEMFTPGANIGRDARDDVALAGATCLASGENSGCGAALAMQAGAVLRAGQIAGAVAAACEMAIEHANVRVQFGKPIGRFQVVQQSLAQLAGEAAAADVAGKIGARALDRQTASGFEIGIAKIRAGEAAGTGAALAHQIHGAIGFTDEYSLHDFTRRLWSWRSEFGSERYWSALVGRQAAAKGEALWSAITEPE